MHRSSPIHGSSRLARLEGAVARAVVAFAVFGCSDPAESDPGGVTVAFDDSRTGLTRGDAACEIDPRVESGLVSAEVCAGARIFFDETFDGNGRTCATCHRVEANYTIDPVFIAGLPASDPLFVAHLPELAGLESSHLTDGHALIKEHVDGFEDADKFVLRSVQHLLSIGTTLDGPAGPRTGWSGDGSASGDLSEFLNGAIREHFPKRLSRQAGVDFRLATDDEVRRVELFQRALGRTSELDLTSVRLSDSFAEAGRELFIDPANHCNECHSNAGANPAPSRPDSNFDTGVERLIADEELGFPRFAGITLRDGGFGGRGLATPNFPSEAANSFGDGRFNVPSLIEAADTGPFFHDNASPAFGGSGINAAIGFYNSVTFNTSAAAREIGTISLPGELGAQVGAFLRVLNGAFNLALTAQRLRAAELLSERDPSRGIEIQMRLLELAGEELRDAILVLTANEGPDMYPGAVAELESARLDLAAAATPDPATRSGRTRLARGKVESAWATLGQNLNFELGEGNLMF